MAVDLPRLAEWIVHVLGEFPRLIRRLPPDFDLAAVLGSLV